MNTIGAPMAVIHALRKILRRDNAQYGEVLVLIPKSAWPKEGPSNTSDKAVRIAVYRSRDFLVQVFEESETVRISVNRTVLNDDGHFSDGITWDDLQRIKREVGLSSCWMVEVFPPDTSIVNVANMRHLWVVKEKPLFAWK